MNITAGGAPIPGTKGAEKHNQGRRKMRP